MSFQKLNLGELCNFQGGSQPPKSNFIYEPKDDYIRFLQIRDFGSDKNHTYIPNSPKNKLCEVNDIMIGRYGASVGKILRGKAGAYNVALMKASPHNTSINKEYFWYYLNSSLFQDDLKEIASRSAQDGFSKDDIYNFQVPLPPLATQQKIVAKLDAIFAEVDKATAAAESNAKNAEELFQSYLSNIQAPISTLGKHVTIKTGKLDSNASVENGIYPFFTCSKEIFSINDYAFDCEAVLLAGNNASGDFNVKHYKGKFNAYQRTYVISIDATDKLTYRYLYFQLVNSLRRLKSMSVGANTKFLKIGMIRDLEFPLPKMDEQIKILRNLTVIDENTNLLKNVYLKKVELSKNLKQSVLKQAFNGELVKE